MIFDAAAEPVTVMRINHGINSSLAQTYGASLQRALGSTGALANIRVSKATWQTSGLEPLALAFFSEAAAAAAGTEGVADAVHADEKVTNDECA